MKETPAKPGEKSGSSAPINLRREVKSPEPGSQKPKQPIPDADLCDRLLNALEQAALDSSHSMEALRLAVSDFTAALRDQGTTPEAVLISLKSVINGRVVVPRRDLFADRRKPEIHEKISTWAIQEFFRTPEQT